MLFVFRRSPKTILRGTIGRHFVVQCLGIAKPKNSICIRKLAKKTKNEVLWCRKLLKWHFKAFPRVKRCNLSILQVGSLRRDTDCSASLYRQTMNRLPWIGQRQLQLSKEAPPVCLPRLCQPEQPHTRHRAPLRAQRNNYVSVFVGTSIKLSHSPPTPPPSTTPY